MARSVWKGLNISSNKLLEHGKKVWYKNIVIREENVGMEVSVYNGQKFINVLIEEKMIGNKLGSFVLTKKLGGNIHKKKKKVKKSKR